jgi:TonB family protein
MQASNSIKAASQQSEDDGCPRVFAAPAQKPRCVLRLVKDQSYARESGLHARRDRGPEMGADSLIDVEFPFLKSTATKPFSERLAGELADAVRAIRQDPAAFIRGIRGGRPLSQEKNARTRAGIMVAIVLYAVVLSLTYVSYRVFHRQRPNHVTPETETTYLASVPMAVRRTAAPFKEPGGRTSNDPLKVPTVPTKQPKAGVAEIKPTPRPPDQTTTGPPATVSSTPYSPASETASRDSASDGVARGRTGNGVGTASQGGRGGVSNAEVNYNEVFSISKVTTRPQILARPVPGYAEEARRAHVEGAVKLSVVLNANGMVSDIRVAQTLGYGLDEKAMEAARELRFVPAQKDGHAVSVRVLLEFKFTLL